VRDRGERRLARRGVGLGPERRPAIDLFGGAGVDLIGDQVRKQRELIAPALDVLIANAGVGKRVDQRQPRAAGNRLERDRDPR
jgi:hypothetical protein